jgi:hypothetical protein
MFRKIPFAALVFVIMMAAMVTACNSSDSDPDGDVNRPIPCQTNMDCPNKWICDPAESVCKQSSNPCDLCDPQTQFCENDTCVDIYPSCPPEDNCHPGQTCDYTIGKCTGAIADGDKEEDAEETPVVTDGDEVLPDGDDAEPEPDTSDPDVSCRLDSDCPANMICGPSRMCVPDCTVNGCESDEGTCNPVNGRCECCSPHCEEGEQCNYNTNAWYCGSPCEPPCPQGYACSGGSCIELRCPTCPSGYYCDASTCFVCKRGTTDGDNDIERRSTPVPGDACLPATAPCVEGVSECCSGACIMGNCM